jgi:prevent-host-death family protein
MAVKSATEARANLFKLIDETVSSHAPITITGKRGNAVLISEEDWNSIQETLYLLNIEGMRESIIEGLNTPVNECDKELDW